MAAKNLAGIKLLIIGFVRLPLADEFGCKRSVVDFDVSYYIYEFINGDGFTLQTTQNKLAAAEQKNCQRVHRVLVCR